MSGMSGWLPSTMLMTLEEKGSGLSFSFIIIVSFKIILLISDDTHIGKTGSLKMIRSLKPD